MANPLDFSTGMPPTFIADDEGAKGQVAELPLWLRLYGAAGMPHPNVEVLHE